MAFPSQEHQFKPGQSGNPGGRPRYQSLTAQLRDFLEEQADIAAGKPGHGLRNRDVLIRQAFSLAINGDASLLKMLWERMDGKVGDEVREEPDELPRRIVIPEIDERHTAPED